MRQFLFMAHDLIAKNTDAITRRSGMIWVCVYVAEDSYVTLFLVD